MTEKPTNNTTPAPKHPRRFRVDSQAATKDESPRFEPSEDKFNPLDTYNSIKTQSIGDAEINEQEDQLDWAKYSYSFNEESALGVMPCDMLPISDEEDIEGHLFDALVQEYCIGQPARRQEMKSSGKAGGKRRRASALESRTKKGEQNQVDKNNSKKSGCKCKKTHCLKIYCECFMNNLGCNEYCSCLDCANLEQNERSPPSRPSKRSRLQ